MMGRNWIITNGAGLVKTIEDMQLICASNALTRITPGTFTYRSNPGNRGRTYAFDKKTRTSINSKNMPNEGIGRAKGRAHLRQLIEIGHAAGKKVHPSIVGSNPPEWVELGEICFDCGADGIELDFGCGNTFSGDKNLLPLCFDVEACAEVLDYMQAAFVYEDKQIGVKISSPISEASEKPEYSIRDLLGCINACMVITEVVAINTLHGREMVAKDGTPALAYYPPGSSTFTRTGSLGGAALKKYLLKIIPVVRGSLFESIRLLVLGGIFSGRDVMLYRQAAITKENPQGSISGFACATACIEEGPGIFSRTQREYEALLFSA